MTLSSAPFLDPERGGSGGIGGAGIMGRDGVDRGRGSAGLGRGRDGVSSASSGGRHEFRSRSPGETSRQATKQKILLAALALGISLVSFVVQTETAVYIQHKLGWSKAYGMMYVTHGSWILLWPLQLLYIRLRKRHVPWRSLVRSHLKLVKTTAQMVMFKTTRISTAQAAVNPLPHTLKQIATVASALTVAGSSWYIAVNMTTPSDLTAIYNCSAFFAYAFSVPMLRERVRLWKVVSVAIAIVGVMVVAYGDGGSADGADAGATRASNRALGNIIIGVGSVLYGLYEVVYKKVACPPENTSPGRSVIFANVVGTGIGFFTLTVLWIPLPILHWTGLEKFEIPRGEAAWMLAISVASNVAFSGAFLVLISLTSPVLSSVAALLTIFLVAITDWLLTGVPLSLATTFGGVLIIGAFGMLAWDSWKEMSEEEERRMKKGDDDDEDDSDEEVEDERINEGVREDVFYREGMDEESRVRDERGRLLDGGQGQL